MGVGQGRERVARWLTVTEIGSQGLPLGLTLLATFLPLSDFPLPHALVFSQRSSATSTIKDSGV